MLLYEGLGPLNLFDLDADLSLNGKAFGRIGVGWFSVGVQAKLFNLKLLELAYDAPVVQPRFGAVNNGVLTLFECHEPGGYGLNLYPVNAAGEVRRNAVTSTGLLAEQSKEG